MSRQTQTTIAVSLPEDVIDHILGFVAIDPLRSCSLVSRSWLPLAQRRLFREVNVSVNTSTAITSQAFQGLSRLFSTTSPHLAPYIRHISLRVILPSDLWTTSDVAQQLCLFLRHLERLGSARMMFHSSCWIPDLVHCLQKLVSQPTFESLFLTFVGTPVVDDHAPEADILNHCTYVRHLVLDITSRPPGLVLNAPPSTINLPGLQTLNLRFLHPETYTLYTPKLQALSLCISFSTSHELDTTTWSLIPRVPLSVAKLTLSLVVNTPRSSYHEFPSFGDYTNNVKHLTLIAKLDPTAQTYDYVLDAIDSLFSTARQKNLLDLRTVSLKFHAPCDFNIALRNLRPNAAWASLDAHLNALLCSGRLESLFFDFRFSDRLGDPLVKSQRDRSRKMSEFMEDCLPHISRSGIISVKVVESF